MNFNKNCHFAFREFMENFTVSELATGMEVTTYKHEVIHEDIEAQAFSFLMYKIGK